MSDCNMRASPIYSDRNHFFWNILAPIREFQILVLSYCTKVESRLSSDYSYVSHSKIVRV